MGVDAAENEEDDAEEAIMLCWSSTLRCLISRRNLIAVEISSTRVSLILASIPSHPYTCRFSRAVAIFGYVLKGTDCNVGIWTSFSSRFTISVIVIDSLSLSMFRFIYAAPSIPISLHPLSLSDLPLIRALDKIQEKKLISSLSHDLLYVVIDTHNTNGLGVMCFTSYLYLPPTQIPSKLNRRCLIFPSRKYLFNHV